MRDPKWLCCPVCTSRKGETYLKWLSCLGTGFWVIYAILSTPNADFDDFLCTSPSGLAGIKICLQDSLSTFTFEDSFVTG